ncbi:hypothetical protein [Saccharicrinis sp. 156]|uniref:hypothetical protein n=1 Tax=Saccharicrinis sp. 156 TaxID=3417574 RepID=UPI003D347490
MKSDKILSLVLAVTLLILVIKINRFDFLQSSDTNVIIEQTQKNQTIVESPVGLKAGTHQTWVSLTVAESKRLIAKGLVVYPPVKERLRNGKIILTKGTTNTYVAEEMIKDSLNSGEYVYGYISPAKSDKKVDRSKKRNELVFVNGTISDIDYQEILPEMKEGDIIIKGANIINHQKGQAAILIGHPTGGTTGNIYPFVQEKKLRFIIPAGLEKESSGNIDLMSRYSKIEHEKVDRKTPWLWSVKGELFTEIEAIKQFAELEVIHYGSGGIGGAEGAVSLLLRGSKGEINKALRIIESIQGEEPYLK